MTRAFRDLGYFFTKTNLKVIPKNNNGTADLLVEILDEGSQGIIDEIDITGNRKNTREEVLKYLGLASGMAFSRDLITKTNLKLWRSARFLDYQVKSEFVDAGQAKLKLNIELTEYELAPPMNYSLAGRISNRPVPQLPQALGQPPLQLFRRSNDIGAGPRSHERLT